MHEDEENSTLRQKSCCLYLPNYSTANISLVINKLFNSIRYNSILMNTKKFKLN